MPEATIVLEGVGHIGTQSAPERVATAVREFAEETTTRPM
ncbi:hypothetical protein NJ7G_0666 [Natrinema sp. J7-2]|nr:hypothetical protein NJ7G_0666 [Natrinema sp. J7-2]